MFVLIVHTPPYMADRPSQYSARFVHLFIETCAFGDNRIYAWLGEMDMK
jgi:hypothetical protein